MKGGLPGDVFREERDPGMERTNPHGCGDDG